MLLIDAPLASISQQVSEHRVPPALFGAAVYVSSFAALTIWELSCAVAQASRIMPDVPTLPSMMTEEEKMTPFATPLTAISIRRCRRSKNFKIADVTWSRRADA